MKTSDTKLRLAALIPLGRVFDEVYLAVASCGRGFGAESERVPAEFSKQSTLARAQVQIAGADLVVADITAKNPNILYQVGYAHALGKKVILLAQQGEDLAFERAQHSVVIYAGNLEVLRNELREMLSHQLRAGDAAVETPAPTFQAEVPAVASDRERFFSIFGDLLQEHGQEHRGSVRLENERTFVVEGQDFDQALVEDLVRRARGLGIRLKLL